MQVAFGLMALIVDKRCHLMQVPFSPVALIVDKSVI